jgi:hypothetical protein
MRRRWHACGRRVSPGQAAGPVCPSGDLPAWPGGEPRPEALTWQLASRKGSVDVDRDVLQTLTWIPCMPDFPEGQDRQSWAAQSAALWWGASGLMHGKRKLDALAAMLSAIHTDVYAAGHSHMTFIHLPDPRLLPLPVQLGIWAMDGERDETLRLLVNADDPEAIEPPTVEEFTTERLGTGLRTARRHLGRRGEVHGYLDYAWRCEEFETDLRLFTFSWSPGRLQRAIPDIEALARALFLVTPRPPGGSYRSLSIPE